MGLSTLDKSDGLPDKQTDGLPDKKTDGVPDNLYLQRTDGRDNQEHHPVVWKTDMPGVDGGVGDGGKLGAAGDEQNLD